MIPYKGLTTHNPASGSFGDCFRTVVASMLEVDPSSVPHFFADGNAEIGYWRVDVWLAHQFGLRYVETQFPGGITFDDFAARLAANYPDLYLIVGGSSGRADHVVIMLNGKIVSDPDMLSRGLVGPTSGGYYAVGFLVSAKHKP